MPIHLNARRFASIVATGLLALIVIAGFTAGPAAADDPTPAEAIEQVWRQLQVADSYSFTSDVEQVETPALTPGNVGASSTSTRFHVEGEVSNPDDRLLMTLWLQGGHVKGSKLAHAVA